MQSIYGSRGSVTIHHDVATRHSSHSLPLPPVSCLYLLWRTASDSNQGDPSSPRSPDDGSRFQDSLSSLSLAPARRPACVTLCSACAQGEAGSVRDSG